VVKAALERSKREQEEQAKTDAEASAEPAAEPASALSPAAKQVQAAGAPQPDLGNEDIQMAMDGDGELGTLLDGLLDEPQRLRVVQSLNESVATKRRKAAARPHPYGKGELCALAIGPDRQCAHGGVAGMAGARGPIAAAG